MVKPVAPYPPVTTTPQTNAIPLNLVRSSSTFTALERNRELGSSDSSKESRSNRGKMTIHLSVEKGHLGIVKCLIECGAELDAQDDLGFTPLHYAAKMGHTQIVDLLVKKGACIDSLNGQGFTPLHVAADEGKEEVVRHLICEGADLNARAW
jgi:ankyrin repeat protein